MNRPIKFRLYCKGTSSNLNFQKPGYWKLTDVVFNKYFDILAIFSGDSDGWFFDDFILEQSTGCRDYNGRELFEGDRVIFTHLPPFETAREEEGTIVFNQDCAAFEVKCGKCYHTLDSLQITLKDDGKK